MFADRIDIDDATPAADCPIRRDLALLAAGLDTRFLKAGTALSTAIEMIDRVIGGLDGVVAALDERVAGVAVADLRRVADDLTALPGVQATRTIRMDAVAGIAQRLNEQVLDMHQTLRVLSIYGMNIKIAASGEPQFVGFVDRMTVKLGVGSEHLDGFIVQLKELAAAVAGVQKTDRLLARECAKVVPAVPAALARDADDLAAHMVGVATMARKVAAIARSIQGKVAVVLGALQVGDSMRQRLEHVVSALHLVEANAGGDQAVVAHVDRLLAAQLHAAMADFGRETKALLGSLADLAPDTADLLRLIGDQSDGDARDFLTRLDRGITDVESVTGRLREAEGRTRAMATIISNTVTELSRRLAGVTSIRVDVQDIATNTRLLCRRHGTVGKAVSVVATEVDVYAVGLGSTTAAVAQAIARLGEIERSQDVPYDGRDMGDTLADALAVIRRAYQRAGQVTVDGGDDARRLIDLLAQTHTELAGELAIADIVEAAARTLSIRTASAVTTTDVADTSLRDLLPRIAALYTMASERQVHASFLLPGMEAAAAPVVLDDDDDDGLF